MKRLLLILFGSMILAATLARTVTAQEYSNGYVGQAGRGPAVVTPVEAFGVHPPGIDPADANRFCKRLRELFVPYYAPAAPVASSARWKPWCYFPLMPYYTPYYVGYCPKRLHCPKPPPYGWNGWGNGPMPDPNAPFPVYPLNYGVYTSVLQDDTIFWKMGGNGLVPYGTPRPPHNGPPDLVDGIQSARSGGGGASCATPPGEPAAAMIGMAPPLVPANAEKPDTEKPDNVKPSGEKHAGDAPESPK